MKYFELYQLPITLQPDQQVVKRRYFELSRQYHPDMFSNTSPAEQEEILQQSSAVNEAYKVLTNPDAVIKYVLQQKGLIEEDEKYQLPPDFLMEMMELNEAANEGDAERTKENITRIENEIYAPVKHIIEDYKEGVTSPEALLQVKEYYFKKKYLNRILEGLS